MPYKVAVVCDANAHYSLPPFNPPSIFPELKRWLPEVKERVPHNRVYSLVREALRKLGLDNAKYATQDWNPLGPYVTPGDTVVIKPNLVIHESGSMLGSNCLITSGAVLRPIIDYAYRALNGRGKIIVADAPLQSACFESICESSGLTSIKEYFDRKLNFNIDLLDLRQVVSIKDAKSGFFHSRSRQAGDPQGYINIDLAKKSAFEKGLCPVDPSRFAVTDYVEEHTRKMHEKGRHVYTIAKTILSADTVICVPKLKVHEKVGITCCLKGMVGIVGSKDCLPHFRSGSPSMGGDEYMESGSNLALAWGFARSNGLRYCPPWLWHVLRSVGKQFAHMVLKVRQDVPRANVGDTFKPIVGGAWYGNDTAWRMVEDLNYIFRYATSDGALSDTQQRRFLGVVDGIVAGEGNGPLEAAPRHLGLIVAGDNAWAVDAVCATLIGMDWQKIPMLRNSSWLGRELEQQAPSGGLLDLISHSIGVNNLTENTPCSTSLLPPPGWIGHVELNSPRPGSRK